MVDYLEASRSCKEQIIDCCLTSNFDEEYNLIYPKLPGETAYHLIARYPDPKYDKIKKAIKNKFGVKAIALGCGSEDLIIRLNHLALINQWRIGFLVPIFYRIINTYTTNVPKRDLLPSLEGDISQYDAVWLQNPNLFNGQVLDKYHLLSIISDNENTRFFVDEAGMFLMEDWQKHSLIPESASLKNMIVMTSFSKLYGISGLRAGFASGTTEDMSNLEKLGLTFPISSLTEYYLLSVLEKEEFFNKVRSRIAKHKLELSDVFDKKGIIQTNSPTNCLFLKRRNANLYKELLEIGIQGCLLDNEIGLDKSGFVRLTVHSSHNIQNELLRRLINLP